MAEPVVVAETGVDVSDALARLRSLVELSDVEGARAFVKEVETQWPDDDRVRQWARVLAPPRVISTGPASGRTLLREKEWLKCHAREYPGCWLALDGPRLIAANPDLNVVRIAAVEDGAEDPLFHFHLGPGGSGSRAAASGPSCRTAADRARGDRIRSGIQ